MATASSPLLQNQSQSQRPDTRPRQFINVGPIIDVQPATYYTETDGTGRPAIFTICQNLTCNYKIYLARTMDEQANISVVECPNCKEWSPFKPPPEGFRFVRCSCRMLIRCSNGARETVCPRPECKKKISLGPDEPEPMIQRYQCAYCINEFEITGQRKYVRCDVCGRLSSVGQDYTSSWVVFYVLLGLLVGGGGIVLAVLTYRYAVEDHYWYIYFGWVLCGVLGFVSFVRAGFLSRIKVSYRLPTSVN